MNPTASERLELLTTNFRLRGYAFNHQPVLSQKMDRADYTSCYRAVCINCGESVFILEFKMGESAFVHAFLFVTDIEMNRDSQDAIFDFDIYIGNSDDYLENKYCGNYDGRATNGAEAWCNLEGKFIHMVKTDLG